METETLQRRPIAPRSLASKRSFVRLLLLAASLFPEAPCIAQERAVPDANIWTGQSGGFLVKWTTSEIAAAPAGVPSKTVFSARQIALMFSFETVESKEIRKR